MGLCLRPSAPAVGQHGGSQAAGVCATEERWRTVPHERKKRISHLTALGARPRKDFGGFWDEGRESPTRGTQPHLPIFFGKIKESKNLPNNGIIEDLTFRVTPKLKMTFGPVWLAQTGLFYWLGSSEELARLILSTSD